MPSIADCPTNQPVSIRYSMFKHRSKRSAISISWLVARWTGDQDKLMARVQNAANTIGNKSVSPGRLGGVASDASCCSIRSLFITILQNLHDRWVDGRAHGLQIFWMGQNYRDNHPGFRATQTTRDMNLARPCAGATLSNSRISRNPCNSRHFLRTPPLKAQKLVGSLFCMCIK